MLPLLYIPSNLNLPLVHSDSDSAPVQLKENRNISQRDWESAVANAEDETDATGTQLTLYGASGGVKKISFNKWMRPY